MNADTPSHSQGNTHRQAAKLAQQAAALRANLGRRKDQARQQATPSPTPIEEDRHVGDAR